MTERMKFRHFSRKDFQFRRSMGYYNYSPDIKPEGLWIDTPSDRDWPFVCDLKGMRFDKRVEHTVTLKRNANILYLHTVDDIKWFHDRYYQETERQPYAMSRRTQRDKYEIIRWNHVVKEYDGIFITFYDEEFADYLDWFWAWDLASGCIWNLDAIDDIFPVIVVEDLAVSAYPQQIHVEEYVFPNVFDSLFAEVVDRQLQDALNDKDAFVKKVYEMSKKHPVVKFTALP